MSSVEIICLGQAEPFQFDSLPFAVESENSLISHRFPSHFQYDLDQLNGCIYHLGNPDLRELRSKGAYTAYDLMNKQSAWDERIRFANEFIPAIKFLLRELIAASPSKSVVFTSDYQGGPVVRKYFNPVPLHEFWKRHEQGKLWMNAMYYLE